MAQDPRSMAEHDVIVERFTRRTIRIGSLVGGVEKPVEYDMKVEKPTHERVQRTNGEAIHFPEETKVEYRVYREVERDEPRSGELSNIARKQNIFTLTNPDDVSYREFVKAETMYLVSWDNGASVYIKTEEELNRMLRAGRDRRTAEESTPTDVLANALDRVEGLDTDAPEQPA